MLQTPKLSLKDDNGFGEKSKVFVSKLSILFNHNRNKKGKTFED